MDSINLKLAEAKANPLGAIGLTRWLNSVEFEALYRISRQRQKMLLKMGALQGIKMGRDWRIFNPGWDIANAVRSPWAYLENAPMFTNAQAAEILGIGRCVAAEYRRTGKLKSVKIGGQYYYSMASIRDRIRDAERFYKKRGVTKHILVERAKQRLSKPPIVAASSVDPKPDRAGS